MHEHKLIQDDIAAVELRIATPETIIKKIPINEIEDNKISIRDLTYNSTFDLTGYFDLIE